MLRNVESTFNVIWRAHRNRGPVSSFLLYWAVLSLGPILIGLALGISNYLVVVDSFFETYDSTGIGERLLVPTPLLLTAMAFSLPVAAVLKAIPAASMDCASTVFVPCAPGRSRRCAPDTLGAALAAGCCTLSARGAGLS